MMRSAQSAEVMPIVETDRSVIDYFNRDSLKTYDSTGYFLYKDVIVTERGQRDIVRAKLLEDTGPMPMVVSPTMGAKPK